MPQRPLAPSISIAPIMFGTNVFGWTVDEPTAHRLLDHFVARGFNAIDTADVYGDSRSEQMIGSWLKARKRRDDVVIATKVGYWQQRPGLSAANIAAASDESLARLSSDYIDVYYAHRFDADTPQEDTLAAFDRLVAAGKVKALGASNFSGAQLRAAQTISATGGYAVLQPHYNLYDRQGFEADLQPVAREAGFGVTPYFGLASGFLSGKYRSKADLAGKPRSHLVERYLDARGMRILAALDEAAAATGASPAQIAIAWLMAQPTITAPIVSATSIAQLDELLDAATLTLPTNVMASLDSASAG